MVLCDWWSGPRNFCGLVALEKNGGRCGLSHLRYVELSGRTRALGEGAREKEGRRESLAPADYKKGAPVPLRKTRLENPFKICLATGGALLTLAAAPEWPGKSRKVWWAVFARNPASARGSSCLLCCSARTTNKAAAEQQSRQ